MTAASDGITTKDKNAKEAVDKAIKALGGKEKIDGIKSLVIKATVLSNSSKYLDSLAITDHSAELRQRVESQEETPKDMEIRVLFPDNFIRINRYPEKKTLIGFEGFSNGKAIRRLPPQVDENSTRADEMRVARYPTHLKQHARTVIGMIMKSGFTPATISSGAKPGVFEMSIQTGQKYYDIIPDEIEFDADGYPSVIKYISDSGNATEERYSERFSVDGIMFPRVITNNGLVSSVIRIEEVRINPKLSLKDFEIPR